MEAKIYSQQQIEKMLKSLPKWQYKEGYLFREYTTENWKETVFLFNAIAVLSEARWHHPDVEISFKKLVVKLKTHDVDGITNRDFCLADEIENTVVSILGR